MYRLWVFVHIAGALGFMASHGVSMGVSFRLRKERDPAKVVELIRFSKTSVTPTYISLGVLLLGGIVAGFMGSWWGYGWIWGAIVTLVALMAVMSTIAAPYHNRLDRIASAMAEGSRAVTAEQFDEVLRSRRPLVVAGLGFAGLLLILYLMMWKPTLGLSPQASEPEGAVVEIAADELEFTTASLAAPASEPFTVVFENRSELPHNVAIYTDESAEDGLFVGEVITGPQTIDYGVEPLEQGSYFFRCDVHPDTMTGTLEAG